MKKESNPPPPVFGHTVARHFELLGKPAKDKITGFKGVVSSISFDLYGCIQGVLTPQVENGEVKDGHWFDVTRIEVTKNNPVMALPDYAQGYVAQGRKGAADKPLP